MLSLYDDGLTGFVAACDGLAPAEWEAVACGEWTVTDVARHVLAVAGWYHDWLDRAERGAAEPRFPVEELASHNAAALTELGGLSGPDASAQFVARARAYRDRLPARWDLPFGYPRGTVTAGLHAGVAACEWHLHAWDVARARGRVYRVADPATLYVAVGDCAAVAEGGVKGQLVAALVPLGSRLRPWEALLRRSGRAPGADD